MGLRLGLELEKRIRIRIGFGMRLVVRISLWAKVTWYRMYIDKVRLGIKVRIRFWTRIRIQIGIRIRPRHGANVTVEDYGTFYRKKLTRETRGTRTTSECGGRDSITITTMITGRTTTWTWYDVHMASGG